MNVAVGRQWIPKDHGQVEAYGAIGELNSHLGVVHAQLADPDLAAVVDALQNWLFDLGADLATPLPCPTSTAYQRG